MPFNLGRHAYFNANFRDLRKTYEFWMSDSNSMVRDLRKLYRFRVKGEQQK